MAINIQSLFSDIIETPAQRQERLMMEGVLQSRQITGGVTNPMVPTALASTIAQRAPQRQENIRRAVGGLLGLDVRTDSERVQEALSGVDPSSPGSILRAAQMIGDMGLGAQAAQMRQMAADVVRQRQADEMAQQQFAVESTANLQQIEARGEQISQARAQREETVDLRNSMADMVSSSDVLSDQEKSDYKRIIMSGGYDNRVGELENMVSGRPILFGNRAMRKTPEGWEPVQFEEDTSSLTKAQGLISSAAIQYGSQSPEFQVVRENIINGNITKAGDFGDYAALPTDAPRANIPNVVEEEIIRYQEEASSAEVADRRVSDAIQLIFDNRLLETGSAGSVSDFFELTKNIAGTRDAESFLRTAYARERNNEIINSLPPGVASDKDIEIFSAGFPPDNASIAEILEFLQAAQRINSYVQDESLLLESFIQEQVESGRSQDVSMNGFRARNRAYGEARKALREREEFLNLQVQSNELTVDQAKALMDEEVEGFRVNFGFTPTIYLK